VERALTVMLDADSRQTDATMTVLLCRVADLYCALPGARVTEVARRLAIAPFARMQSFILGLSTIRGMPVPVVDPGNLLNAASSQGADDAVATIRTRDGDLLLVLDTARPVSAHLLAELDKARPLR
jgi:purine-binding chemotaxis protein CheW